MTILNTFVIIILVFLLVFFYNKAPIIFPITLPFILNMLLNVISSAYIEEGIYMADISKSSYMTGGTIRMALLYVIFIISMMICYKNNKNRISNFREVTLTNKQCFRILCLVSVYVLYLCIDIFISGSTLTNPAITRFNYYGTYSTLPLIPTLSGFRTPMALICGVVFNSADKFKYKIYSCFNLGLLFISWYLVGNQFTGLIYLAIYFFMPILVSALFNKMKVVKLKNIVLLVIAVIVALIPKLSYFQNHGIYGLNNSAYNSAFSLFLYRAFGLQAETWWELDRQISQGGHIDFDHTFTELGSLFRIVDQKESGIYYLMNRVMNSNDFSRFIDGNGTLCSGHPALEVAMWGYIGAAIAMIIEACLFFILVKSLVKAILEKKIIDCIVISILFTEVIKIFNVGGFFWLTNTIPLYCLIYLFITHVCGVKKIVIGKKDINPFSV